MIELWAMLGCGLVLGCVVGMLISWFGDYLAATRLKRQEAAAAEARLAEEAQALEEATAARRAVVQANIERMAGWMASIPLDKLLHLEHGLTELEFTELQALRRWWEDVASHPEWFRPIGVEDYDQRLQVFYALYQEADLFFTSRAREG